MSARPENHHLNKIEISFSPLNLWKCVSWDDKSNGKKVEGRFAFRPCFPWPLECIFRLLSYIRLSTFSSSTFSTYLFLDLIRMFLTCLFSTLFPTLSTYLFFDLISRCESFFVIRPIKGLMRQMNKCSQAIFHLHDSPFFALTFKNTWKKLSSNFIFHYSLRTSW